MARKVTVSETAPSRQAARPGGENTPEPVCTGQIGAVLSSRRGRGPPPSPHAVDLPPVPVLGGQGSNPPSTCTWGKFRTLLRLLLAWPGSYGGRKVHRGTGRVLLSDEPTAGLSAVLTESVLAGQVRALAEVFPGGRGRRPE